MILHMAKTKKGIVETFDAGTYSHPLPWNIRSWESNAEIYLSKTGSEALS
jgi:hypothetical protein